MTEVNSTLTDIGSEGRLVVLSGFSGVGKGTVVKTLLSAYDGYDLSISATTRAPREGEMDGREYHFLTREAFENMISRKELIEYALYCENYYGTPRTFLEKGLAAGRDVILEIEVKGALNIRRMFPNALLLFMMAPSAGELVERLSGRGTESDEVIRARLERAVQEAENISQYDYIVVNDTPEQCAARIHTLKNALGKQDEQSRSFANELRTDLPVNQEFIQRFRSELKSHLEQSI